MTAQETLGVSGIAGVPWDAVELPVSFWRTGAMCPKAWHE